MGYLALSQVRATEAGEGASILVDILMKELGIEPPNLEKNPADSDIEWFKWLLDYLGKDRKEHQL